MGVPAQSKSLLLVTQELGLWGHDAFGEATMLGTVEDENSSIDTHSGYDIRVLGLVSSLVDLSRVVYLLLDMHFNRSLLVRCRITKATNLSGIFIKAVGVWADVLWDLNIRDLKVVLCAVCSVSPNQETVDSVFLSRRPAYKSVVLSRSYTCAKTYSLRSGNHWVVKVGHSSAVLLSVSSVPIAWKMVL